MSWIITVALLVVVVWLLRENYRCEKRWRAARYAWTKLSRSYFDDPDGDKWQSLATLTLDRHRAFLKQFGVVPLSASALIVYEETLTERAIEPLD